MRTHWLEGELESGGAGGAAIGTAGSRARQYFGKRKFGESEQLYEEDPNKVRPPSLCASSKEELDVDLELANSEDSTKEHETEDHLVATSKDQTMEVAVSDEKDNDDDGQQLISSNGDGADFEVAVDVETEKELKVCQFNISGSRFTVSSRDENVIAEELAANCSNNLSNGSSNRSSPEPSTPLLSTADNI